MGLAPILFSWNHFSPFITLPVSETYLRLRSARRGEEEGKKRLPSLSSLGTFKIHKSRGLGFLSAILHNNEISNILCKNSWQEIFFSTPRSPLLCSVSPYQKYKHASGLTRWEDERAPSWRTQIPPNHITCISQRRSRRGELSSCICANLSSDKPFQYASRFRVCFLRCSELHNLWGLT